MVVISGRAGWQTKSPQKNKEKSMHNVGRWISLALVLGGQFVFSIFTVATGCYDTGTACPGFRGKGRPGEST